MRFSQQAVLAIVFAVLGVTRALPSPESFSVKGGHPTASQSANRSASLDSSRARKARDESNVDNGVNPLELFTAALMSRRIELGVCVGIWCAANMVRNARSRRIEARALEDNPPGVTVHALEQEEELEEIGSNEVQGLDFVPPQVREAAPQPSFYPRPEQLVVEACNPFMDVPTMEQKEVHVEVMQSDLGAYTNTQMLRGGEAASPELKERLKIGFYFALWYALNVVYNIVNKKVLNVLPAPLIVGSAQLGIGALYIGLIWALGLRTPPQLTAEGKAKITQVGLWHSLGQLASSMSLGAGPVSFTHIVKAVEPFFSAVVSGIYFQKWMQPQVYATLLPVVGGVGYACLKERSFSWLAFSAAMASNLAFALRAVLSKIALQSGRAAGTNLTPPNMFGVVTWAAFLLSVPLALIGEGADFGELLSKAFDSVDNNMHFIRSIIISGLLHYLNNEVMYLALGSVHPVTLAVGNTMKRVFIMVASIMVFRNPISLQAGIGAGIGISGVLLYSLTKQYYEAQEAKKVPVEVQTFKSLPKPEATVSPSKKASRVGGKKK